MSVTNGVLEPRKQAHFYDMYVCVRVRVINAHGSIICLNINALMHVHYFMCMCECVCVPMKRLHRSMAYPNLITNTTFKLNHMHG